MGRVGASGHRLFAVFGASTNANSSMFAGYHRLLRCSKGREGQTLLLPRLLGSVRSYGCTTVENALQLFDEMTRMNPIPSVVDFSRLISPIVKMKQYAIAISLFRQLESLGIPTTFAH
uniref:Pentatricopeptide repeat-containing protein n=1 Tax=Opuntia streptacantha TaxID=393608 RepID=A0A7C9A8P7_OPUST